MPGTTRENTLGPTDKQLLPARSTVRDLREYAALGGTMNVIALDTEIKPYWGGHGYVHDCLASVFGYADSDVACTGVAPEHLRKCRRSHARFIRACSRGSTTNRRRCKRRSFKRSHQT